MQALHEHASTIRAQWAPFQGRLRSGVPVALFAAFAVIWSWAAYKPIFRDDWFLENILVFVTLPLLVWLWLRRAVSDATWCLLFVFYSLHVIGSHWTYSNVPLPWKEWGFERNHYDRVVHFAYGLLLVAPFREMLCWRKGVHGAWAWVLALQLVVASSAFYEILEWVVVEVTDPEAGGAFLGTQGDEFDAVKDMALAGFGALLVTAAAIPFDRSART